MEWLFIKRYDGRNLTLRARVEYISEGMERIRVSGKNRSIILQNNRPLLEAKGLKHKRIEWKLKEGSLNNAHVLEIIINSVEAYIKSKAITS